FHGRSIGCRGAHMARRDNVVRPSAISTTPQEYRRREWATMLAVKPSAVLLVVLAAPPAFACSGDATSLFSCEAARGRKFIELCAPSPLDAKTGFLQYRFGTLTKDGSQGKVELEFPKTRQGSLRKFFAATYTHEGVYTQSVRFVTPTHDYRVFTEARGNEAGA